MGSAFLYVDINFGGQFFLAFQDEPVLPDPIRFQASSLETLDRRWSTFWETIFFNPDDDQLWIEGAFKIPNLHTLARPHGNNHWGDRINAVSFPSQGPTGDNDNRTIIHADGRVTVGNNLLSHHEIAKLELSANPRKILLPSAPLKSLAADQIRLEIDSDTQITDGSRVCRIRARAVDGYGSEIIVSKLSLRIIGTKSFEETIEHCSEVAMAVIDTPIEDSMDQLIAIASSPGIPVVKKVISARRGLLPAFIPNTNHVATFGADGQVDRGADINIEGPRIQVFHGAEDLTGLSSAHVNSTVLIQQNVVQYRFIRPTEQTEYYQVTPGIYTHTLEATAFQDPSFPSPPFPLAKAVSTLRYFSTHP